VSGIGLVKIRKKLMHDVNEVPTIDGSDSQGIQKGTQWME